MRRMKFFIINKLNCINKGGQAGMVFGSEFFPKGQYKIPGQAGVGFKIHNIFYPFQPDIIGEVCSFFKVGIKGCSGEYIKNVKNYA